MFPGDVVPGVRDDGEGRQELREGRLLHRPLPLRGAADHADQGRHFAGIREGNPVLPHTTLGEASGI